MQWLALFIAVIAALCAASSHGFIGVLVVVAGVAALGLWAHTRKMSA